MARENDANELFIRCHGPFDQGFKYSGHRHWIDHYTFVHDKTVLLVRYRLHKDGTVVKEQTYEGPCRFLVAAGLFHEIEVLSEIGKWDCEFQKPDLDSPLQSVFNQELID
jgi:hypothetical protein